MSNKIQINCNRKNMIRKNRLELYWRLLANYIKEQDLIQTKINQLEATIPIQELLNDKWDHLGWMSELDRLRVIKFTIIILEDQIRKTSILINTFTC